MRRQQKENNRGHLDIVIVVPNFRKVGRILVIDLVPCLRYKFGLLV